MLSVRMLHLQQLEVEEHAGPLRSTLGTGGHRTEEVVAQRDGKREGLATKTQLGTDVERDASDLHVRGGEALARPTVNHRTEDPPGLEDDGARFVLDYKIR